MTSNDDGTLVLTEADIFGCVIGDLSRRGLVEAGRPHYVRLRLVPEGACVMAIGDEPVKVEITVEPRAHS